jgi:predicted dehydrogenase
MEKIRVGIFGYCGGSSYVDNFLYNNGEVVAVCEKREDRLEEAKTKLGDTVSCYKDFDEFINHDMDAVLITNYFHEHTDYIIRCLEKNIHVLTECVSNATMAEGVRLVEAAEKSKAFFMLAENYPYMLFNQEMKKVYDGGALGKCLYAEGEYNHAGNPYTPDKEDAWENVRYLYDSEKHWRCFVPKTYYVTHSLAPIMFATGASPVRVTAMPIFHPMPRDCSKASYVGEKATVMTCLNDDDSVFKFTGHAAFGGSENSYRLCCEKGMIENVRGSGGKVMLRYNPWEKPEDKEIDNFYQPVYEGEDAALAEKAGHGGGDFFVVKEFFRCIRENEKPKFDVYFATRMASVGILAHRSQLEFGVPYDIPDFRKKEDRDKWRDDTLSPFYYSDGREPTMPCTTRPDFKPSETQIENFRKILNYK